MAQTPFKMQEMLLTRLEISISYAPAVVSALLQLDQVGCQGQSNMESRDPTYAQPRIMQGFGDCPDVQVSST
jgi:hypothetical protein